jgi:hypothetical protein
MLAAVSASIAGQQTNIGHATVEQRDGDVSILTLEVEVRDRKHLARIVRAIRNMPEVLRVTRTIAHHSRGRQRDDNRDDERGEQNDSEFED